MSENNNARILRFHLPDKVFHSMNAILWFALVITGAIVYLCDLDASTGEMLMTWHIGLGIAFTFCLFGYIFFAPDRFAMMMHACMTWDKNTILWFRNFGGYPRRFFHIPLGPVEVPPQGRYNGGQKASLSRCSWSALTFRLPCCRCLTSSASGVSVRATSAGKLLNIMRRPGLKRMLSERISKSNLIPV